MSTYAVSDLHGHLDIYNQINSFIKPEDNVICLGDCSDRGPQPWETLKAALTNPQWTYIMGNHDHMLAAAMYEYLGDDRWMRMGYDMPIALLAFNGGMDTLQGWIDDGADLKWAHHLEKLPYSLNMVNDSNISIFLSHAGWTPNGKSEPSEYDLIWDRHHFKNPWPNQKMFSNWLMVHGHTPCEYLADELTDGYHIWSINDGAIWYADTHKVDIDMCTYKTKAALLLDLDTFDEHIFIIEDNSQ